MTMAMLVEHLTVAVVADEHAVLLQRGQARDAGLELGVGDREPQPRRLGDHGLFVDHLLDDPLLDAELLEELIVDLRAVRLTVGVDLLLVEDPEVARLHVAAVDRRDRIGRLRAVRLQEAGHIQQDKRQHDNPQAPLEPGLVAAHPIEHRHRQSLRVRRTRRTKPKLCHGTAASISKNRGWA